METIEKMTTYFAWIVVIVSPIYLLAMVWLQKEYNGSLNQAVDRIKGIHINYFKYNFRALIAFNVALVYLISHY